MQKGAEFTEQIAAIPLFQGLPRENYEELAMIAVDQVFPRGRMIFSQGDAATGLYVVISGRVKIYKVSPEGKEQTLHIFGSGEPIGEVAVFAGRKFPAFAETLEETRVFFFPRDSFVSLIAKNPAIALNMLAVLSLRLRKFSSLIEDLSLKEVPGRLAAYLLYSGGEGEKASAQVELDISKNQLASVLGTIPETLSRILSRMSRDGFLETKGRKIRILDRKGLEELAAGERRLT